MLRSLALKSRYLMHCAKFTENRGFLWWFAVFLVEIATLRKFASVAGGGAERSGFARAANRG